MFKNYILEIAFKPLNLFIFKYKGKPFKGNKQIWF